MSHPSRVRGLKPRGTFKGIWFSASHPSRVRGLKPDLVPYPFMVGVVAPLAGAWIETNVAHKKLTGTVDVAPLAGAWIETDPGGGTYGPEGVAPLAGAWIETGYGL